MDYIDRSFQAVSKVICFFAAQSKNVCLPIKHVYAYDLIVVYEDEKLLRIKVVQTDSKSPSGAYVVNLRKSGGYKAAKEKKSPFDPSLCDALFVISPIGWYMIPTEKLTQTRAISLSMFEEFKCTGPS